MIQGYLPSVQACPLTRMLLCMLVVRRSADLLIAFIRDRFLPEPKHSVVYIGCRIDSPWRDGDLCVCVCVCVCIYIYIHCSTLI
jgi:hypothetical protein